MALTQYKRKAAINPSLIRILLFLLVWGLVMLSFETFGLFMVEDLFEHVNQRSPGFFSVARGLETIATLGIIYLFRKRVDHRDFLGNWFTIRNYKLDLPVGFAIGAVLIIIGSFILGQSGLIELTPGALSISLFFQYLLMFLIGALLEEIVFRGYILENLLEDMHPILAVLISSLLFMLLHLSNPNLEALSMVNLALAGIMMSASFVYTKNLWFPLGLHWAWNFFQGPIFGYEVSGLFTQSFFHQEIKSNFELFTGGEFGFEGSLLATILMVLTTFFIYRFYFNKSKKNYEDL